MNFENKCSRTVHLIFFLRKDCFGYVRFVFLLIFLLNIERLSCHGIFAISRSISVVLAVCRPVSYCFIYFVSSAGLHSKNAGNDAMW